MFKKTIASILLVGSLFTSTGCGINQIPNDINDTNFPTALVKSESDTKLAVSIGTTVLLLSVDNANDRAKIASTIYDIAVAVNTAIKSNTLDLQGLKVYATELINKSDSKDKEVAGLLLNSVVLAVENQLKQNYPDLSGDRRVVVGKSLVRGASDGIIDSTVIYKNMKVSTTQPVRVVR